MDPQLQAQLLGYGREFTVSMMQEFGASGLTEMSLDELARHHAFYQENDYVSATEDFEDWEAQQQARGQILGNEVAGVPTQEQAGPEATAGLQQESRIYPSASDVKNLVGQGTNPFLARYFGTYEDNVLQSLLESAQSGSPGYAVERSFGVASGFARGQNQFQFRNALGQFAGIFTQADQRRLEEVLRQDLLENYDRLVTDNHAGALTGTLRKALEQGEFRVSQSGTRLEITFQIADLQRPGRETVVAGGREVAPPTTHFYGPIVFQGRGAIVLDTAGHNMTFYSRGAWRHRGFVGAAEAKDIWHLTDTQESVLRNLIQQVIAKGIKTVVKQDGGGS